jgi:hypothetical protein
LLLILRRKNNKLKKKRHKKRKRGLRRLKHRLHLREQLPLLAQDQAWMR